VRDLPTEAIERVDILPEEVALKYGYAADQRVVNFELRPRFRAVTGELADRLPTAGGHTTPEGNLGGLQIPQKGTARVHRHADTSSALTEDERDVVSLGGGGLFDRTGNVAAPGGGEIDPALSALAGETVTVAAVPASAASGAPTLDSFVPGANAPNLTSVSPY